MARICSAFSVIAVVAIFFTLAGEIIGQGTTEAMNTSPAPNQSTLFGTVTMEIVKSVIKFLKLPFLMYGALYEVTYHLADPRSYDILYHFSNCTCN
ncbi:hypothetical protein C0J52_10292 [Blattella germanica]|nr:hypothetical protein C0J52_10292 [Blattella germanica]